ncbi:MAG: choice-of-anchor D domain-containing protein [Candidatus Eisenbacteria bacterium]|nr:choice-of-anchor D domain-containing protein [Candidatus Eisenbacteria bacterium]
MRQHAHGTVLRRRVGLARGPAQMVLFLALSALLAHPALAIKVCTYNATNFPDVYLDRVDAFRTVMDTIDADLIVLQEVDTWQAANLFRDDILNYNDPGKYRRMPFTNGPDTDNACFFKPAVLDSLDSGYLDTGVRYTNWYKFRPDGYASSAAEFVILSTHLKAGSASSDQDERLDQTTVIRNYLNDYPTGSNFMVAGDFNIQASSEGSYQMLIGYLADNDGRSKDPIATGGTWHDNYSLRYTHTQSPRVDGGSWTGGGMDDRFDFILVSYALDDGSGLDYVTNTYVPFGNDGLRFNLDINNPPNQIVSAAVADALYDAADHIPVFLELQVPARIDVAGSLDFGDYIIGATAEEDLTIQNTASVPGEALQYSMSAPSGFGGPGSSFVLFADTQQDHTITMGTSTAGVKSGDLTISSNALDDPDRDVSLSGRVLRHASPSLDDLEVVLSDTVDFGSHGIGMFSDQSFFVHNDGFVIDSLQALLDIHGADIVGGDGRFSFVGGFSPELAGATPAEYSLSFDGTGSPDNTLYEAILTLSTRDDPSVVGGGDLDDLTVHISAFVTDGTSIPDGVLTLALSHGSPNPFSERTALSLTLPASATALVEIYDVAGRVVATLADGSLPAGENRLTWDGVDSQGTRAATGIYFCRAQVGDWKQTTKIVLLR